MGLQLDKNNTGFNIIEPGEYEVFPHVFANEVAKKSGNKMVQFNYIIRDDVDQDFKGQQIRFDNFVETEGSLWRVNQASDAAGLDMEQSFADIYAWAEAFKNKAVRVRVGHREWQGKKYPEIQEFLPSRYGGEFTGTVEESKPSNPVADNSGPFEITDDDLPF